MIRYVHFDIFVIHFGLFLANTCVMQRPSMHVIFFAISFVPTMTLPDSIVLDRLHTAIGM